MFALPNMAMANTFINDWDAKFTYNFWRPITAIRNGDIDGNDATEGDLSWVPSNTTPMHPEYPSQAAIVAGSSERLLELVVPSAQSVPVTATDLLETLKKRQFSSIKQLAEEQCNVRVWGGIHFRNSLGVGMEMGGKIADYLVEHSLTPSN